MKPSIVAATIAAAISFLPGPAFAQTGWTPGSEIVGLPVQVTTNGVTNTIYLDAGGAARILTPAGSAVAASWTAANNQLCLINGTAEECFPYVAPFHPGIPITLTSSCHATSTWVAASTNSPPPNERGERGE